MAPPLFVIDASALLATFLPEENWEAEADSLLDTYQDGRVQLVAPALLSYEVLNSLYLAVRGKAGRPSRLTEADAEQAWTLFHGLGIPLEEAGPVGSDVLKLAFQHRWRSVYDLAYVALAQKLGTKLITADAKLAESFKLAHPLWEPLPA